MAKVYLACEAATDGFPFARRDFERLQNYAQADVIKKHVCVNDPDNADLVVFVGSSLPNYADVKGSGLYQKHKDKSIIVDTGDRSVPIIPGVYTCLERRWFAKRRRVGARSGFYLRVAENRSMDMEELIGNAAFLFSFVGNSTNHPCRAKICRIKAPRSLIVDTATDCSQDDGVNGVNQSRGERYRESIAQSKFVLCPRGIGVSSWRVFETMRAGRVPVIISDNWLPSDGPYWNRFAIFVRERRISSIPDILEKRESEAEVMGSIARNTWEQLYSSKSAFSTMIDLGLEAHKEWHKVSRASKAVSLMQYLEPHFFHHWLAGPLRRKYLCIRG